MQIVALESQDQTLIIDNIINTYIKENSLTIDSDILKILKQILASLSNYIKSSYCIGGGLNNFHEVYLPFTLRFVDELTLRNTSNSGNGYMTNIYYTTRVRSVPKLKLFSRYFNLDASKNLTNQEQLAISDIRIVKSDRKITLPKIPLQLQAQTKLPLPKDISTTTATDLQFL